jgi:6,7-dimethyl-8-ribityllumazine synthase
MKINNNKENFNLSGKGIRVAVVFSEFNNDIGEKLLDSTIKELKKNNVPKIKIFKVPGALEIPVVCKKIITKKGFDVIIALGVVIKGETSHYTHVSTESLHGIQTLAYTNCFPVISGILTVLTKRQAIERINNGISYARSAIQIFHTLKNI